MTHRPPRGRGTRRLPARDAAPPEVPEVSKPAQPEPATDGDPIPDHIRHMLEAAYT